MWNFWKSQQEEIHIAENRYESIIKVLEEFIIYGYDLEKLLNIVVWRAQELLKGDGSFIVLMKGNELLKVAEHGIASQHQEKTIPMIGSLTGITLNIGEVLRSNNALDDPRLNPEIARKIGYRSVLCAPLIFNGQKIGVLTVVDINENAFYAKDIYTLGVLGKFVSAAIVHAQDIQEKELANHTLTIKNENLRREIEELQERLAK